MSHDASQPLFVHVHIHKCAGTAFNELVRRSFAPYHLDAYIANPFPSYQPAELDNLVRRWPTVRSIASHSIRIYPQWIGNRRPLYVCFLREPIDWFVSYLTYAQTHLHELTPEHVATFPRDAASMPLADLAAAMVQRFTTQPTVYCTFIRYLAESAFRHALSGLMDLPPIDAPLNGEPARLFDAMGLHMAQRTLSRFFFVGVVEQMPQSLQLLRQRLQQEGIELRPDPLPEVNVTRHKRDDLHWLSPDHPTGAMIRHWLKDDLKLYQWAADRLASQAQ